VVASRLFLFVQSGWLTKSLFHKHLADWWKLAMSDKKSTKDILAGIRGGVSAPKPAAEDSPTPAAPETAAAKPAAGGSPLDAIRAGGAGAKPAGGSPLDAIRAGGAGAKPAGGSPLDAIRAGGGGAKPAGGSPLDAIRAGAGGAAKVAPVAKAAAKAAPLDMKAAAGMSAADMISAARKRVVTADPVTGESMEPKKVALPKKPLVKPSGKKATETRRSAFLSIVELLLSPVVVAWSCLTGATAISGLAMARFMMPNVLVEPPTKFKIGPGSDYGTGTVSTKWKAQFGVWIVNDEVDGQQMVYALSTVCTHLGCTPNWLEGEQKFKCPCHGSGFYKTGINFEGPAPRPLERYGIRLAEDGMLEVDKSVKFQRELGQWEIAASYVPV
jgi:cytochrome b6-f complex iron-sulfur subunit